MSMTVAALGDMPVAERERLLERITDVLTAVLRQGPVPEAELIAEASRATARFSDDVRFGLSRLDVYEDQDGKLHLVGG